MDNWRPTATVAIQRSRADMLVKIRKFFADRQVMEVETPLLSLTAASEPHLQSIPVNQVYLRDNRLFYLQSSPEYAMKKLLASGSGCIYQICKAFRQDERSSRHNPEFTMLEWYRSGFDEQQLMDEVVSLVKLVTGRDKIARYSYRELFRHHLALDPHSCETEELLQQASGLLDINGQDFSRDDLLQLLLAEIIEPAMNNDCIVYDFPHSMAALSVVEPDSLGTPVARRFELFLDRMEIANGYRELTNAAEQKRRFDADNRLRDSRNQPAMPLDQGLLAAMTAGIPECAGVAIGLDRLLMVAVGAKHIDEVLGFGLVKP